LRRIAGYLLVVTALLACPCHLALLLPVALGLFGGTAAAAALGANIGWVLAGATVYFVGALAGGLYLLSRRARRGVRATEETQDCCPPPSDDRKAGRRKPVGGRRH
jgi:mercuric ion transport protein